VADEEKKTEAGKKDEKPKGKSKLLLIVGAGVVILAGAGGAFFFMKKGASEPAGAAQEAAADAHGGEGAPAKPQPEGGKNEAGKKEEGTGLILDLDPFIVNLADTPEIRYLKVTIKLELTKEEYAEEVNTRMAQIRDSLLILLSSKEYASIRTVEGKMELRDEIFQRLNTVLKNGVIRAVYFTDFVAQ
jgi:flagellar FliL protein